MEFFSPQGTLKAAGSSEPMVVFGDPRLQAPFHIICPEQGKARWADLRNCVDDFDRACRPALSAP